MALFSVTLSNPTTPNHPISDICLAFHIFVVGGEFKLGKLVDRSKC